MFTFQGIPEVLKKNTVAEQYKCVDFKVLDSDVSYKCYFGLCWSSLFIKTGMF